MALISELNTATAEVLTFPLPTVAMFSRTLREAGLISKKGRGRGAAHAVPLDGARQIIALMATASPAQAPDCVTDFGALVQGYRLEVGTKPAAKGTPAVLDGFTIEECYGLPRQHTFEEALTALLAGFNEERFTAAYVAAARPVPHGRYMLALIEVDLLDTALGAGLRLGGHTYHYTFKAMVDVEHGNGDALRAAAAEFAKVGAKYRRGIHSRRTIDADVLRKIALVINGGEIDINNLLKQRTETSEGK